MLGCNHGISICSLAVHVLPSHLASLQDLIGRLRGVEIHAVTADGRVVVTIEAENAAKIPAVIAEIRGAAGVISAALAFHQTESGRDGTGAGVP
jgi:periplasmic nitrate reductase NapD